MAGPSILRPSTTLEPGDRFEVPAPLDGRIEVPDYFRVTSATPRVIGPDGKPLSLSPNGEFLLVPGLASAVSWLESRSDGAFHLVLEQQTPAAPKSDEGLAVAPADQDVLRAALSEHASL